MRLLGYRTVDALVDWLSHARPPLRRASPDELAERLHRPLADDGQEFEDVLCELLDDVLPFTSNGAHPAFFAYVPFAGTWPGALGDFVASAANVYAGSWQEAAGPTQLELEVVGWFKEWIGYPGSAGGTLVTGGSAANLTALACAREARVGSMRDDLVVYASDQTHSSVARAARALGFRPDQLRVLPVDDRQRLEPHALAAAIGADEAAGRLPFLVVANAGATSTGAIDPLPEIAALCRERELWLHVDAAYGGFAVLTDRGAAALEGLGLADSVTLDPHKWLYQPYECGCILVRDGHALRRAFQVDSDYLRDAQVVDAGVNLCDHGLQLTRTARAFKIWLSLRTFGLAAFRAAVDRSLDLAEHAVRRIDESEAFERAAPPSLGIVTFRRRDGADVDGLVAALEQSGVGLISSTRVDGVPALRLCVLAPASTAADVDRVLDFLAEAQPSAATETYERDRPLTAAMPLFARLEPDEASALDAAARIETIGPGETVVEQWSGSRDFYVVLDGTLDVSVNGSVVATLRAGEHFGEIAALEWGAGFARSRAATVVARDEVRLQVVSPEDLKALLARFPRLDGELRRAAGERLRHAR
jgi:glutamate/tyrosine decarboxylase-like PLP-dependent enzyme